MIKTKNIKIETLERRFKKLHTIVIFAQENCKAILFHAKRLENLMPNEEQNTAYQVMIEALNNWCNDLNILVSTMEVTKTMYYKHLSTDGLNCEVMEAFPMCIKCYVPNTFLMSEALYRVGYYEIEGDPFKIGEREYSAAEIMKNIQELETNVMLCLKSLITATYTGIWEFTGSLINRLYDSMPNAHIDKLFASYCIEKTPKPVC